VRYHWFDVAPGSTRWEQAFSHDQGATWVTNWVMTSSREAELQRLAQGGGGLAPRAPR
jgi:hypothetical protein